MFHLRRGLVAALALSLPALAACTDNSAGGADGSGSGAGSDGTVQVTSRDDACELSTDTAPSGNLVFTVKNEGSKVTEFYLYDEDGTRIVGEVENIGPGLSRDLVVRAAPGSYVTACKPGMTGDGIRADFTVTDSGADVSASDAARQLERNATDQYADYVRDEVDELLDGTRAFVAAYQAGRDDKARALYPQVRVHWERVEPVAESFGDLDPRMDLREADLAEGQEWTGWHLLEKDLWPPRDYQPLTDQERQKYGDQLVADTEELHERTRTLSYTVDQIGNGAKELLDEVATGKVTGEEEIWSHTDLWDFQVNVDGAQAGFEALEPLVERKDPELEETLDDRFEALQDLLGEYRTDVGFVSYTALSEEEVKELSDAVNALSEPLSQLTATVTL
ncbi:MAG TPA: iron uptake system protein EfeO [Nocardioidaceae bacterium]|nr:iron uptake system protein EfeO [Nocardioidaceae bacterium]